MIIGWGNLAGSDVRLFPKGIGRYAKTPTYWREGFELEDSDKLKPCYPPSPLALQEDAITSLSSNFRTFGSRNPLHPEHRESGLGMTKPNGVEFRIFDHFPDKYIGNLSYLVSLVAENSRKKKTSQYVYKNKYWIEAVQQIMTYGYRTVLNPKYIGLLRKELRLRIKTKSLIAFDVFKNIFEELVDKNINGDWFKIFIGYKKIITMRDYKFFMKNYIFDKHNIPEINKKGYHMALAMKMNRSNTHRKAFIDLCKINGKLSFNDFEKKVISTLGKSWKEDTIDIAYFLESYFGVELSKKENGTIESIDFGNNFEQIKVDWNKIVSSMFGNLMNNNNIFKIFT